MFHNFQKHLITLFRNHLSIGPKASDFGAQRPVALSLWQAFNRAKSTNKRVLHIIFGMAPTLDYEEDLHKLASEFREFKTILNKRSIEEIEQAQKEIREEVIRQAGKFDKDFLETNCHVQRFDFFCEYLGSFLSELREGPVCRRMTKMQKKQVLMNLREE